MKYQPPYQWPPAVSPPAGIHNMDPNAGYVNHDPAAGVEGSNPPAEAFEHPMREILAVITDAGLAPNHAVLTQLRDAIKIIAKRDVSLVSEGSGVVVYNGKDTESRSKIRSLKAGTNITLTLDEDGSLRITAAGGTGGGGGTTLSGEGVAIVADVANLNFPGLSGQPLVDDPDLFAFYNQAVGGSPGQTAGHRVLTWAQLKAAILAALTPVVQGSITLGSDVLNHEFNTTGAGFQNLGAATPLCPFPDVDLTRAGGQVHLHLAAWALSLPTGNIVFEISVDGGGSYLPVATINAAVTGGLGSSGGAGDVVAVSFPRAATYAGSFAFALVPDAAGAIKMHWQPQGVSAPGSIRAVTPTSTTIKARARYTGTGTPLRVHGRRVISNVGGPLEITSPGSSPDTGFDGTGG